MFTKREFLEEAVASPNKVFATLAKSLQGFTNTQNVIRNSKPRIEGINMDKTLLQKRTKELLEKADNPMKRDR